MKGKTEMRKEKRTLTVLLAILMALVMCALAACTAKPAEESQDTQDMEETVTEEATDGDDNTAGVASFGAFETADLDGNVVTEAVFAEKDLTIVNVWGTFCDPCIGEMPDLAALDEDLPDNVQIIGILCDVSALDQDEAENARTIIHNSGVQYPSLLLSKSLYPYVSRITAVPTTFLVDSQGNVIGEPIVGADVEAYRTAAEAYLGQL